MTTQNIPTLGGNVAPTLEKGTMGKGVIIRMTLGSASDFMTEEQIVNRKVTPDMQFIEMEICETESRTIFSKSFRYYEGNVPANSVQGKLIATYGELAEDGEINLMTKEVGRADNPYVIWELATV